MPYFCYISASKLAQVHSQASAGYEVKEAAREQMAESVSGSLAAQVRGHLSLLRLGGAGEAETRRQRLVDRAYTSGQLKRLEEALQFLVQEGQTESLGSVLQSGGMPIGRYSFVVSSFRVSVPATDPVELATRVAGYDLEIACSLENFSYLRKDKAGGPAFDSMNYHFLSGKTSAELAGLVMITGHEGMTVYGSPLYLVYAADDSCLL